MTEVFDEVDREVNEIREVKAVEPNHGARSILAMVMPVPCWRQDYISTLHFDSTAVHGSVSPVAFDDKAHGECSMAMRRGHFVWHDKLKASVNGVGGEWCS